MWGEAQELSLTRYQGLGERSPPDRVAVKEMDAVGMAPRRRVVELLLVDLMVVEISRG